MADGPALLDLLRRPDAQPRIGGASLTVDTLQAALPPVQTPAAGASRLLRIVDVVSAADATTPTTPGAPSPATVTADPLAQMAAVLARAIAASGLMPPPEARPWAVRGTASDAVAVAGPTTHDLATATVPKGHLFIVRRRVAILDTASGDVRGGLVILRDGIAVYDGTAPMEGVTATEPGEFVGGTGLDEEMVYTFPPGARILLRAVLARGANPVKLNVHGSLKGHLVPID